MLPLGAKSVAPSDCPQVLLFPLGFAPDTPSCGLPEVHQQQHSHSVPEITSSFHSSFIFCEGILRKVISKQKMKEYKNSIISQG